MNKLNSAYLDLLRLFAAIVVFVGHLNYEYIFGPIYGISLTDYGNDAVIVFFVLSGFIIAEVTSRKETTLSTYIPSRASRLYSVSWLALFLTIVFDHIGIFANPAFYQNAWWYQDTYYLLRVIVNASLFNQTLIGEVRAFSNGPFWSLGYEIWFYVLFIPIFFLKKNKVKIFFLLSIIAGLRVAILFPIWYSGVILHSCLNKVDTDRFRSLALSVTPIFIYIFFRYFFSSGEFSLLFIDNQKLLKWLGRSDNFIENYFIGALVWVHIFGTYNFFRRYKSNIPDDSFLFVLVRKSASLTYPLYAVHYPLIHLIAALSIAAAYKNYIYVGVVLLVTISLTIITNLIRPYIYGLFSRMLKTWKRAD